MAGSFRGQYQHKISDTGRISVPSKFREILKVKYGSDELTLLSMGDHLRLYPSAEWDREEARLESESTDNDEFQEFLRYLYSEMDEVAIDGNGRIQITSEVRQRNGIQGECIVNGFRNHFELWPAVVWGEKASEERKDELFKKFASKIR
ncbi:division/cell wall cluster transcriptional repressor MraZ [Seleniivibrio sp.]|uniref:division/cell wall cluster transcriptional repressor MraZ n=1 Tax=Seleniivibrio sp. TaxID=2898801 RepID=UPI0025D0806B|nr:division/cell wall cluster transcriptional repressor MraZ [Seleniivibrio sp.]MCD8552316.1 division/cell wall cluster transcriptional repressor MraZ [Seleniivibrio sp.]